MLIGRIGRIAGGPFMNWTRPKYHLATFPLYLTHTHTHRKSIASFGPVYHYFLLEPLVLDPWLMKKVNFQFSDTKSSISLCIAKRPSKAALTPRAQPSQPCHLFAICTITVGTLGIEMLVTRSNRVIPKPSEWKRVLPALLVPVGAVWAVVLCSGDCALCGWMPLSPHSSQTHWSAGSAGNCSRVGAVLKRLSTPSPLVGSPGAPPREKHATENSVYNAHKHRSGNN